MWWLVCSEMSVMAMVEVVLMTLLWLVSCFVGDVRSMRRLLTLWMILRIDWVDGLCDGFVGKDFECFWVFLDGVGDDSV